MTNILNILFGSGFIFSLLTATAYLIPDFVDSIRIKKKGSVLGRPVDEYQAKSKLTLTDRIEALLYQARAPITPAEFIGTSVILGVAIGGVFFFSTRALLISILASLGGGIIYYIHLLNKSERLSIEYEDVQPQIASMLWHSFRAHGLDLDKVLIEVSEKSPPIVQGDWITVRASLQGSSPDYKSINAVLSKRSSPGLSNMVELIVTFRDQREKIPDLLNEMREEITLDVEDTRETIANLSAPRRELGFMALMPIFITLLFASTGGAFGAFYRTFTGQLTIIGAWLMTGITYFWIVRSAKNAINPRERTYIIPEQRESLMTADNEETDSSTDTALLNRGGV